MRRIDTYVQATGSPQMVYMILGFFAFFLFVYFALFRKSSG